MHEKIMRLIASCETVAQLEMAKKYITLANKSSSISDDSFSYYTGMCSGLQLGLVKIDTGQAEYLCQMMLSDPDLLPNNVDCHVWN